MVLSGNSSSSISIDASLNLEGETEVELKECFDKINTDEILRVAEDNNNSDNRQCNGLNKKMVLSQDLDKSIGSESSPLIDTSHHFKQVQKMNKGFNSRGILSQISENVVSLGSITTIIYLENSVASAKEIGQLNSNVKFVDNEFKESSDPFSPKIRSNTEVPLNSQSEMEKIETKDRSLSEVAVSDTYSYENYPNWKKVCYFIITPKKLSLLVFVCQLSLIVSCIMGKFIKGKHKKNISFMFTYKKKSNTV